MTSELYSSTAPHPSLPAILWRVARPLLLFSTVLTVLLTLSWVLLLPRYTQIDMGGTLRSAEEIRQYREELLAQIADKEEERRRLVLAVHDPLYDALKEARRSRTPLDALRSALTEHATSITKRGDAVYWRSFDYDPGRKQLVIRGDVRNVETRSMTVLAAFALSLDDLPFIASSTTPAFTREEDPVIGLHSPFSITLTLQ